MDTKSLSREVNIQQLRYAPEDQKIMIVLPMIEGSNLTLPLLVARATVASSTPRSFFNVDSIRWTHEEHVMPLIWNDLKILKLGESDKKAERLDCAIFGKA